MLRAAYIFTLLGVAVCRRPRRDRELIEKGGFHYGGGVLTVLCV